VGFPENILTSDEKVVLYVHPHWKWLIFPALWLILGVAVVTAAAVFGGTIWAAVVGVIALVLLGWLSFWPWLRWRSNHYVFTDERVLVRHGVFTRYGRDIPLGRINDVAFSHSLIERMLGCGTMTIESAGERGQVILADLPDVERAQSTLYRLLEADRERHTFGDDDREALAPERVAPERVARERKTRELREDR
jgi:uncharacterized membrane protein YdbT with pleckstrin-like domain